MNRIDRISAILIQLQSKKLVKGQEIADRFDISLRTVYRDIKTLEEAGVPILSEAGSGYSIMEGYRLPPVMFTRDEALAFVTAEKLINQFTDQSTHTLFQSALFKIKAVLRSDEKEHIDEMNDSIQVLQHATRTQHREMQNHLQTLLSSIANKVVIDMEYFANHSQQKSSRRIEPIGIFLSSNKWHLIAYCQLRMDYRNFRVDRIQALKISTEIFQAKHPSLSSFLKKVTSDDRELHEVIIRVEKSTLKYFGEQKYYNGFIEEKEIGEKVEMTFLTCSLEGFARWFMWYGDQAEIIKPKQLNTQVKALANKVIKNIK